MNTKSPMSICVGWLTALALICTLNACAVLDSAKTVVMDTKEAFFPTLVEHAFEFDMSQDNQNALLLDYRYGEAIPSDTVNSAWMHRMTLSRQQSSVRGPMLRGDLLYVKWQIKSTGQVYEDTVNLRKRLPKDIVDNRITFLIRGSQLYVYLVTSEPRQANIPVNGPSMYSHLKVITLYPDQPKT